MNIMVILITGSQILRLVCVVNGIHAKKSLLSRLDSSSGLAPSISAWSVTKNAMATLTFIGYFLLYTCVCVL